MLVSHLAYGETATREASKALTPIPKGQRKGQTDREQTTPMRTSSSWRWWWSSSSANPTVRDKAIFHWTSFPLIRARARAQKSNKVEEKQSPVEQRTLRPTSEQLVSIACAFSSWCWAIV